MDFKPFKIGKYLLLERLATGGMAEVYRAKASGAGGFEKQLAIKRILPSYSQNEEFRRMFEYEARLSSMLTHANIVQVYDFVKSGETYLLAMEYVDGKNLRQFVNKSRKMGIVTPVEFAVFVMNEVCKGLEYAHKKKDDLTGKPLNIIHRDMSPQNIMLSYEGAVKIVDFGIAKAKDRVDETRSGVIKGKFGYMSPEQANGEQVDHRTDIFSTGIILFELLTGKRLFAAESDMATLRQIQDCVIPQPSRINPKIPAELEKILMKALAKDIKLRFQNAGLLHRALLEFLNKHYPTYTQKEASDLLGKTFAEEIEAEKRRFEQLHRQSIPFSQGAKQQSSDELDGVEEALEGSITKSEAGAGTAVTFVDELDENDESELDDFRLDAPEGGDSSFPALTPDEEPEPVAEPPPDPQPEPEPEPSQPEVSAGGDTQFESLSSEEDEVSGTQATNTQAPTSAGSEIVLSQSTRAAEESGTRTRSKTGATLKRIDSDANEDSVTPTQARGINTVAPGELRPGPVGRANIRLSDSPLGENAPAPRRGREVSAIKEIGRTNEEQRTPETENPPGSEIQLSDRREPIMSAFEAPSHFGGPTLRGEDIGAARPSDPMFKERSDEDLFAPRKPLFSTPVKLFVGVCLVAVGYRIWMEGQVPTVIQLVQPRDPTDVRTPIAVKDPVPAETQAVKKPLAGGCTLEVTSDPPASEVLLGQQSLGLTPVANAGACDRAVNITIRHDGYETISENVVVHRPVDKMYRTLKRAPLGTLELTVNNNAKVFLDGTYIGDAAAGVKFEKSLRAKKYTLRLVNEVLGIETTEEVTINQDAVSRKTVRLEGPDSAPETARRNAPRAQPRRNQAPPRRR